MKRKKLKKSIKIFLALIVIGIIYIAINYYLNSSDKKTETVKIINEIKKYNYVLDDHETKLYKGYFNELKTILNKQIIDESKYVETITKLFIADFYNLNNKITKNDIGGIQFVHQDIRDNFILNAKDTLYKHIETNVYNDRKQHLPTVTSVKVNTTENISYTYDEEKDDKAYKVNVTWTYAEDLGYQATATIILVHNGIKLDIVELK